MLSKKLFASFCFLSLFGATAHAEFQLTTNSPSTPALDKFLKEVDAFVPSKYRSVINDTVTVQFEALDKNEDINPSVNLLCPNNSSDDQTPAQGLGEIYGKVDRSIFHNSISKPYVIHVHRGFLKIIEAGEAAAMQYPCGHHNLYRLAAATILHELSHIYDFSDNLWTKEDEYEARSCEAAGAGTHGKIPSLRCQNIQNLKGKVSDRLTYKNLNGFVGNNETSDKNLLTSRSPDPYEFTNANEHFAVNMEYFLLDPKFACRKPALFQVLSKELGYNPYSTDCGASHVVYGSSSGLPMNIDPARIYQVHYLFAAKGTQLMSRWGHSMIRLIVCAPTRKEVGPDCLSDIAYHVVIGFLANIDTPTIDYIGGLTGKYPSELMMMSMSEVIDDYARGELRSLISLPLQLTDEQKTLLIKRATEEYWSYVGRYYFLSNNCATEADQLVRGVLDERHPYQNMSALTPLGLYSNFFTAGLTDTSLISDKNKAITEGYYFASIEPTLETAFSTVMAATKLSYKDLDHFLADSTAAERKAALASVTSPSSQLIASFYLLEKQIQRTESKGLQARAIKKLMDYEADKNKNGTANATNDALKEQLDAAMTARQQMLPWNTVQEKDSYGVPAASELISQDSRMALDKSYDDALKKLNDGMMLFFPADKEEQQAIDANTSAFLSAMIASLAPISATPNHN